MRCGDTGFFRSTREDFARAQDYVASFIHSSGDEGGLGNEVVEKSFADYISDLVLFCAEYDASKWKEIYTTWLYSETVLFAIHFVEHKRKQNEEFEGIEDPLTMMMVLLMQRLR
jgi:hypothetical protein